MKNFWTIAISSAAMAALILDTQTAIAGAAEGIEICIYTVIPSIFPFLVVSTMLNCAMLGHNIPFLRPVTKALRIPTETASLWLIGILGGYPVGAQSVARSVESGQLAKIEGERMLSFISNAGPSFIFGFGCQILPEIWMCYATWGIHIMSALITGILTPSFPTNHISLAKSRSVSLQNALSSAVRTMAMICGWIVLFRVLIAMLQRWLFWWIPLAPRLFLLGVLELANGCFGLKSVDCVGLRILIFGSILAFGGLCVAMQTRSVCANLRFHWYLPGKLTQTAISILLCQCIQPLLNPNDYYVLHPTLLCACVCWLIVYKILSNKIIKKYSIPCPSVV